MGREIKQNQDELMTHSRQPIDNIPHLRTKLNFGKVARIIQTEEKIFLEAQIDPQFSIPRPMGNKVLIPHGTVVKLTLFSEN